MCGVWWFGRDVNVPYVSPDDTTDAPNQGHAPVNMYQDPEPESCDETDQIPIFNQTQESELKTLIK